LSSGRSHYSSSDEVVWLETINSRRLWDLLTEARDLDLPLIQAGRQALPVELRVSPASVTLDATRDQAGLALRPRVGVDGEEVPLGSSLLVGKPAHGIAWWDDRNDRPGPGVHLSLAPFAAPVDEDLRRFLGSTPLKVPQRDEERFLRDFYPRLQRRIDVRSSNGSVDLPELPPPGIVLCVQHYEGHGVELIWTRGAGASGEREGLWDASKGSGDHVAENAIVDRVAAMVGSVPELLETTLVGERLAQEVFLQAMPAVRFVSELLPALSEIEGVEIE
jgi:hypothetical protein